MQPAEQRDEVEMLWLMLLIRRFEERASHIKHRKSAVSVTFTSVRKQS